MPSGLWHFALSVGVCSLVDNSNNNSGTGVAPGNVPSSWHGCLPGAGSVFVRLYLLRIVSLSLRVLF